MKLEPVFLVAPLPEPPPRRRLGGLTTLCVLGFGMVGGVAVHASLGSTSAEAAVSSSPAESEAERIRRVAEYWRNEGVVSEDWNLFLVVPSTHAEVPGNSRAVAPGSVSSLRQQILVDPEHLQEMVGREIAAIQFRRHGFNQPFDGGIAILHITMSTAPFASIHASATFQSNVGLDSVTVFQGAVGFPASPAPKPGDDLWAAHNVFRIPFQVPYAYRGGPLCIDIVGRYSGPQPKAWTVDAVHVDREAQVSELGPGTGMVNAAGQWSFLEPVELVAGGQAVLSAYGPSDGAVFGFVGRPAVNPIPLDGLGLFAAGSRCYLDEVYVSMFAPLRPPSVPVTTAGVTWWEVTLPAERWMLGATFASQFFEVTGGTVSNGIQWTVSSTMPTLGMAQIGGVATEPAGERHVNAAHILRFEYTAP